MSAAEMPPAVREYLSKSEYGRHLLSQYMPKWQEGDIVRRGDGELVAFMCYPGTRRPRWVNVRLGLLCDSLMLNDDAVLLIRDGQVQS